MSLIDEIRDKLLSTKSRIEKKIEEPVQETIVPKEETAVMETYTPTLNDKVDEFITWYFKTKIKGSYTDVGEYHLPREMRNFIEKMAVWYELRYPSYEINRLLPGSAREITHVSEVMFYDNRYISESLGENSEARLLEWPEFYNIKSFIDSLPGEEKSYLAKPRHQQMVYLDPSIDNNLPARVEDNAILYFSAEGRVQSSSNFTKYTSGKVTDKEIIGLRTEEIIKLLKERNYFVSKHNALYAVKKKYEDDKYLKEELLNCVMYRIIERGGNRIGPRRAFLFAQEFDRNIDIPLQYGIDYSDPGLRHFILQYLKAGGNENLECYEGYFAKAKDKEKLGTTTIKEILKIKYAYTAEEKALYQRMVDAIATQIDYQEIRKNEVQQLRLQRKLDKSKNTQRK